MTDAELHKIAERTAAFGVHPSGEYIYSFYTEQLQAFAALVASHALVEPCCGNYDQCQKVCMPRAASAERSACLQIVESEAMQYAEPVWAFEIVNDIKARGSHDTVNS